MFALRITGKKRNLPDTVQSSLHQNGGSCAASTEKRHFFADDIKTGVLTGLHITDTVGGVACEDAVLVQNGIHSPGDLGSRT